MHIFEQGTVKIKEALIDFYKGIFNFLGVTTRRGFAWGILIGFLCLFPFFYLLIALSSKFQEFSVICLIIIAVIFTLACYAASFRRLRDIGFKARTVLIIKILQLILLFVPVLDFVSMLSIIAMICITIFVPSGEFKIQNENKFLEFWMVKKGELQ